MTSDVNQRQRHGTVDFYLVAQRQLVGRGDTGAYAQIGGVVSWRVQFLRVKTIRQKGQPMPLAEKRLEVTHRHGD